MKRASIGFMAAMIILAIAFAGCTTDQIAQEPTPTPTQVFTPESTTAAITGATTAPPVSLTGTTWYLVSFDNGVVEAENIIPGTEITAVFGEDGALSGSGGCNSYSATYVLGEGGAVGIGTPVSTLMSCPTPAGVDTQEQLYLNMLGGVESYHIEGNLLIFKDSGHRVIATYSTEPPAM